MNRSLSPRRDTVPAPAADVAPQHDRRIIMAFVLRRHSSTTLNQFGRPPSASLLQEFASTSQLSGANAGFIEALYETYLRDPDSVSAQWRDYFETIKGRAGRRRAACGRHRPNRTGANGSTAMPGPCRPRRPADTQLADKQAAVLKLVTAYRSRGHLAAKPRSVDWAVSPASRPALPRPGTPDLDPAFHGLGAADMDTVFSTGSLAGPQAPEAQRPDCPAQGNLRRQHRRGVHAHQPHAEQRRWVHEHLEAAGGEFGLSVAERKHTARDC